MLTDDASTAVGLEPQRAGEPPAAGELESRAIVDAHTPGMGGGELLVARDYPLPAVLLRAVGLDDDVLRVFVIVSHAPNVIRARRQAECSLARLASIRRRTTASRQCRRRGVS